MNDFLFYSQSSCFNLEAINKGEKLDFIQIKEHVTVLHISQKQVDKYKALCKKLKGIELTDQEAREEATKLAILFKAIYRPITKEQYQRLQERDELNKQVNR